MDAHCLDSSCGADSHTKCKEVIEGNPDYRDKDDDFDDSFDIHCISLQQ
jgi:hypothetical protein